MVTNINYPRGIMLYYAQKRRYISGKNDAVQDKKAKLMVDIWKRLL